MNLPDDFTAPEEGALGLKKFLGVFLIGCGVLVGGWTVIQLIGVLAGEADFALLETIRPGSKIERTITTSDGQEMELPASLFTVAAFGMVVGVLSILATVANALIRAGASLWQPDVARQLERLRRQVKAETSRRDPG